MKIIKFYNIFKSHLRNGKRICSFNSYYTNYSIFDDISNGYLSIFKSKKIIIKP